MLAILVPLLKCKFLFSILYGYLHMLLAFPYKGMPVFKYSNGRTDLSHSEIWEIQVILATIHMVWFSQNTYSCIHRIQMHKWASQQANMGKLLPVRLCTGNTRKRAWFSLNLISTNVIIIYLCCQSQKPRR